MYGNPYDRACLKSSFALSADLVRVDADSGTHRGRYGAGLDILSLCRRRLCLYDCAEQGIEVLLQLLRAEGSLSNRAVDNICLVETVLDFTGLRLFNCLGDVGRNSAGLRVRHESARAEDLTETSYKAHHVGRCNQNVKIHPAFALDFLRHILRAYKVGSRLLRKLFVFALADSKDADVFTCAVGQDDCAPDLLVSVAAVDAQLYVDLDRLIKLGFRRLDADVERLVSVI